MIKFKVVWQLLRLNFALSFNTIKVCVNLFENSNQRIFSCSTFFSPEASSKSWSLFLCKDHWTDPVINRWPFEWNRRRYYEATKPRSHLMWCRHRMREKNEPWCNFFKWARTQGHHLKWAISCPLSEAHIINFKMNTNTNFIERGCLAEKQ